MQLELEGVLHSINAPDNWYGSIDVLDRWHVPMLKEVNKVSQEKSKQIVTFFNN
jgi:hypothetical protein